MKKAVLILSFLMLLQMRADAGTMRQMFTLMPDTILPLLTRTNRLDMLDFFDNGMDAVVTNRLGGNTRMMSLSQTSLSLQYTDYTDITMHMFLRRDTVPVVCIIRTVHGGIEDSSIDFYDDRWNHLDAARLIREPEFEDYAEKKYLKTDSLRMLRDRCELMSRRVTVTDDGLVFRFTGTQYMGTDSDCFNCLLRKGGVRYVWKRNRLRMARGQYAAN